MDAPWLLTPGLYVVGGNEDGHESVLSGPWFSHEEAEADRATWHAEADIAIVGWLR
jgi:hypothetical protein